MIPVFFRKINVVFFHWVNLFIISPEIVIQGAEVAPALVKGTANQIACVTVQMRISGDCAFGVGVKRNFSDFNTAGFLILGDGLADITAAAFSLYLSIYSLVNPKYCTTSSTAITAMETRFAMQTEAVLSGWMG